MKDNTTTALATIPKIGIIYARVSTDEQAAEGTSLENQVERSLKYAQAAGLQIPPEFIFREDYTGKVLERPELGKVRALLKARAANALIVYKTNRLDRSEWGVNLLLLLQELKSLGVELHYSQAGRQVNLNDPVEALMQSISGWQSGEDHRETISKLTEGKYKKVEMGNPIVYNRPPYGYKVIREGKQWALEIDEPQAQVVRLIFQWYVFGDEKTPPMSAYAIAKRLNEMGIPSRSDTDPRYAKAKKYYGWQRKVVGYLLGCETYAGTFHYGKRTRNGYNPKENWRAVAVPAIVSREVWELAQEKKEEARDRSKRNTRFNYLLYRLARCSHCGLKIISRVVNNSRGKRYAYYRCGGANVGHPCDLPYFPAGKVDEAVWAWLEQVLTSPERLLQGLEEYREMQAAQSSPLKEELAMVEGLIREQEVELKSALANLNAVTTPRAKGLIGLDIERIEGVLDGLEKRRGSLRARLEETTVTDQQLMTITEFTGAIAAGLELARQDFNKRRQIVELLNVSGEMVVENGERVVYVTAAFGTLKQRLSIDGDTTRSSSVNRQTPLSVTARLVIR